MREIGHLIAEARGAYMASLLLHPEDRAGAVIAAATALRADSSVALVAPVRRDVAFEHSNVQDLDCDGAATRPLLRYFLVGVEFSGVLVLDDEEKLGPPRRSNLSNLCLKALEVQELMAPAQAPVVAIWRRGALKVLRGPDATAYLETHQR